MDEKELLELLKSHEWKDVEFKEAKIKTPKNSYESVSAFANTEGGHLVFGVKKEKNSFEVVGIVDVDKIQNEFLSALRQKDKINQIVDVKEDIHKVDEKDLIVFYIPEVTRDQKPVFINGDIRKSFLRKGGCDVKCSEDELKRFLRDASNERYDSEILSDIPENFYDERTVNWYRTYFNRQQPGRDETLSDREFLLEWGFIRESDKKLVPTRASVLLFGKGRYIRQILPRAIVDYQRIDFIFSEWTPDKRWNDRIVFEENIIQTWLGLVEKYMRLSESSFSVDPKTLRRSDDPPDYISFREAAINLLIHQDYGDHSRKPVIKFFKDKTIFWNPGDAFATKAELLEANEKEVRNPSIVSAFRRIGLSDQAGTGIRSIFSNWNQLGNIPPEVFNDKSAKTFELSLLKEKLLSEKQILFQSSIGVTLSTENASVFAFACKYGELTITDIKAITGKTTSECIKIGNYLEVQVLLKKINENTYVVAEHLKPHHFINSTTDSIPSIESEQVRIETSKDLTTNTEQVRPTEVEKRRDKTEQVTQLSEKHRLITNLCEVPQSLAELMEKSGYSNRGYFKKRYINPLISVGVLKMTKPDKPNASDQKYALTESGFRLVHGE